MSLTKHHFNLIRLLGFDGITFGKHVFLSDRGYNDEKLLAHEAVHVRQYKEHGFIPFIVKYLWESVLHGYKNNKYEIEANKGALR